MARLQDQAASRDKVTEGHISPNSSTRSPNRGRLRAKKAVQHVSTQPKDESSAHQPGRRSARLASHPSKDTASVGGPSVPTLLGKDLSPFRAQDEVNQLRQLSSSFKDELVDLVEASQQFLSKIETEMDFMQRQENQSSQAPVINLAQNLKDRTEWFKSKDEIFIHPEAVICAIFNVHSQDQVEWGPWRPEPLLRFANAVSLVYKLHAVIPKEAARAELLRRVDHSFLSLFQGTSAHVDDDAAVNAYDVAVNIRTQLLISCLHLRASSRTHDQHAVFKEVFWQPDGNAIRGWAENEQSQDETYWVQDGHQDGLRRKLEDRMDRISQVLDSRKTDKAKLLELTSHFTWADSCSDLVSWVKSSAEEIDAYGNSYGGLENLCQTLSQHVLQYPSRPLARKRKGKSLPLIQELRKISLRVGSPISSSVRTGVSKQERSTKTFADAQSNATKVAPISQADDHDEENVDLFSGMDYPNESNRGSSVQVTQDDGFEDRALPSESSANRKRLALAERHSALQTKKRVRNAESNGAYKKRQLPAIREHDSDEVQNGENEDHENRSDAVSDEAASVASSAATSDAGSSTAHEAVAQNHSSVLAIAQERQRHYRVKQKTVQTRTAWSVEEMTALLSLIAEHGTKWAYMKNIDQGDDVNEGPDTLHNRSAEHMRDKARNLKFDYLRANANLPKNFDRVLLKAAQIELLHAMGIEYTQGKQRKVS